MRLTEIDATELFSFDKLTLDDLPARALVIVGPNGAGKTNTSRLVEIVVVAIERSASFSQESYSRLVQFVSGRRFEAAPGNLSAVGLGIAITEDRESDLLVSFVRAALFTSLLRDAPSNLESRGVQAWVDAIGADDLVPLTRGRILAELTNPVTGQWSLAYEFEADEARFRWVIDGAVSAGALVRVDDADRNVPVHPITRNLELDDNRVPARPFASADLLPPAGEGRILVVEIGSLSASEPVRAWGSLAGIVIDELQRRNYTMSSAAHSKTWQWCLVADLPRALPCTARTASAPQPRFHPPRVATRPSRLQGEPPKLDLRPLTAEESLLNRTLRRPARRGRGRYCTIRTRRRCH